MSNGSAPEKLYKYRPFDARTLSTIAESTVYFANPASFNDPFDCKPPTTPL